MYLTQALHRSLRQAPDAPFTVSGARIRTLRESVDRIARLAGALREQGVGPGDRVAVLAQNSDHVHEALLATWWAGAVANPVNTRWSAAEVAFSLEDCASAVLVVDDAHLDLVPDLRRRAPVLRTVIHAGGLPRPVGILDYEDLIATTVAVPDARRHGDDLAGIFYTGGTTGRPKGVMLSHANLMTACLGGQATTPNVTPGGASLIVAPLFHVAAVAGWLSQLVAGGTVVFLPRFDPAAIATALAEHAITSMMLVPTMIQSLVEHLEASPVDLSSLRRIQYGAAPMPPSLLERARKAFPQAGFGQGYGMTELAPMCTMLTPEDHLSAQHRSSVGRVVRHCELMIADPDGNELPTGQVGEILVRGGNVMLGYWNRPEETATALRGGWLHTGDAGRMSEDGYLFLADRMKDMIISGGENVYSAEVEHALVQHPTVNTCAVIGVPDDHYGERVHAVVVLENGADPTPEELRAHVKTLIAGYKAPRSFSFVPGLPLSAAGKVLKHELRRSCSQPSAVGE